MSKQIFKISILIILLSVSKVNSQVIKDNILSNVIRIDDNNITIKENNLLLNIPLIQKQLFQKYKFVSDVILNDSRVLNTSDLINRVKKNLAYTKDNKITVITPNWDYYDKIEQEATREGLCIEPSASDIYYEISKTENNIVTVDSIIKFENLPKINFLDYNTIENTKISYYNWSYGSTCCPRDKRRDDIDQVNDVITAYEKKFDKKITPTCKIIRGKEGENSTYFSLKNLTQEQKLEFLLGMRKINKKSENIQLMTPILFEYKKCY